MNVVITGGSGFIGQNLVEFFLKGGHHIINLDISPPRSIEHQRYWRRFNIMSDSLLDAVSDIHPNILIHLAARTDLDGKSLKEYAANIDGVRHIWSQVQTIKSLELAVFFSTKLVFKNGTFEEADTFYGESKQLGERILSTQMSSTKYCVVRPTSLWGPWSDCPHIPYGRFFKMVARGRYFHPSGASVKKHYSYVGNAVAQVDAICRRRDLVVSGEVYYLVDYENYDIESMANVIAEEANIRTPLVVPMYLVRPVALIGDLLHWIGLKNFPLTSFRLNNMCTEHNELPTDNLRYLLPNLPYTMAQGVTETYKWFLGRD